MMLSKIDNGAMGAAGNGVPEKAAQHAWLEPGTHGLLSVNGKVWHIFLPKRSLVVRDLFLTRL